MKLVKLLGSQMQVKAGKALKKKKKVRFMHDMLNLAINAVVLENNFLKLKHPI
jgi:hypothetical protein